MTKTTSNHGRRALPCVAVNAISLLPVLLGLATIPATAFAGNTTVFVVPPEGNASVTEVQIPESIAKEALAQLAKGHMLIIETDSGKIQIKGMTRAKELLGTVLKGEPMVLPQPE